MTRELDPRDVAARLSDLRRRYVAETVSDARARLTSEQPRPEEPFAQRAARSLAELRALCELARALHGIRRTARIDSDRVSCVGDPGDE